MADKNNLILWDYLSKNTNVTNDIIKYFIDKPWNLYDLQTNIPIKDILNIELFKNKIDKNKISLNPY